MRLLIATALALALTASAFEINPGHAKKKVTENDKIMARMKKLELHLAAKSSKVQDSLGHLLVNGPLPADFAERFTQEVAKATGVETSKVAFMDKQDVEDAPGVVEIGFKAPPKVVEQVENEAADPNSELAKGKLHFFLVAKEESEPSAAAAPSPAHAATPAVARDHEATPVEEKGIDIDTSMPYGDLEPFGREDTAQELTESSVVESDEMVDQLERAEVAEEKRAVFRALTRLRGAAITSFDGVARSQTGNIDEYNKVHKWRKTHPLHHLADEESDITKWAFPDNAD
jgi:hypothetical protein